MKRKMNKTRLPNRRAESANLVDIIVPTWDNFEMLDEFLKSVPQAVGDNSYKVIIVDNASEKASADKFYRSIVYENVRVIRGKENYGYPRGCNIGVSLGTAPLLFFTNDDIVLGAGSLDKLIRAMDDAGVGVAGMKLLFPETVKSKAGKRAIQHVGLMSTHAGDIIHCYLGWSEDHPKVNATREVLGVSGCCLMTRRFLWQKIGGYDEKYGLGYYEDIDYCLKVRELGYNVIVETSAVGTHYVGSSFRKRNDSPMMRNRLYFMQKWANKLPWTEWVHW